MTLLSTSDLRVQFGGVNALDGVSVDIRSGGVHAFIGPNGAGKTSLINAITGVYRPTSGSVSLDSRDVTGLPPHKLARLGVTRTFQNLQVFWNMTALENVFCGFYLKSKRGFWPAVLRAPSLVRSTRELEGEARSILESVDLGRRSSEIAKNLSYGELKRLEIARAIASKPKIMFLDEPVAGCTSTEKNSLGKVIRRVADESETAVVLVEHDMKLVMSLSDKITVLVRGKVVADGAPELVRNDAAVIEAYLGTPAKPREQIHAVAGR